MTEIELFPALDRMGRPIPNHWDVWLDGAALVTAVLNPLEATRVKLAEMGVFINGVCIKPKVQGQA